MKRTVLVIMALLPLASFGQKLLKPTIDKLNGDTTWSTSREKLYVHGNYLTGQAEGVLTMVRSTKGSKGLVLNTQAANQKHYPILINGSKASFKFSDGSITTLSCSANDYDITASDVAVSGSSFGWFDLSPEDIQNFLTKDVAFLRVETTAGNMDCDIKPKNAEMLKKQFALMANH